MINFCDWLLKNLDKERFAELRPKLIVELAELLPLCYDGYLSTDKIEIDEKTYKLELIDSDEMNEEYMSPELLKHEVSINAFSSVVFSYGVIVDEIIRCSTYFIENDFDTEKMIKATEELGDKWFLPVEDIIDYNDIISACIKVDPLHRPQGIESIKELLMKNNLTAEYIDSFGFNPAAVSEESINDKDVDEECVDIVEQREDEGDIEGGKESVTMDKDFTVPETVDDVESEDPVPGYIVENLEADEVVIGIDLGTSNSTVSVMRNGRLENLEFKKKVMVPSVIFFDDKDKMSFGSIALRKASVNPECMFKEFKRMIGYKKTQRVYLKNNISNKKAFTYIFDTNALIDEPLILDSIEPINKIVIPTTVIEELGYRKTDEDTVEQANRALESIEKHKKAGNLQIIDSDTDKLPKDFFQSEKKDNHNRNDNKVISCAVKLDSDFTYIITRDKGIIIKADYLKENAKTKFSVKKTEELVFELVHQASDENYLELTGQDGAVYFLKYLRKEAIKAWGRADKAVITVPNEFDPLKRKEIEEAGIKAGFNEVKTNSEPVAAAVAYGMDKEDEQNILIYDFGGGTFDVAIIRKDGNEFRVANTGGDSKLGGVDFTNALITYFYDMLLDNYDLNMFEEDDSELTHEEYVDNQFKIWEIAERIKCDLSDMEKSSAEIKIFVESGRQDSVEFEITRKGFEDEVGDLITKSKKALDKTLSEAGLSKKDIDVVILAGGTSTIPAINTFVQQYFGKAPYSDKNPATLIANGAAMLADFTWGVHDGIIPKPIIYDKTVKDMGVGLANHAFDLLIEADADLPVRVTKDDYILSRDNQDIMEIPIFTRDKGSKAKMTFDEGIDYIGEICIKDIPPLPCKDTRVNVTFSINKEGVLEVDVELANTNGEHIAKKMVKIEHRGV